MSALLQVANLEVVYHRVIRVLRGVSLEVGAGQVVALLGPNGAGKTTTLRAITGLLDLHDGEQTKGSVAYDGREVSGWSAVARVRAGMAQVMEGRRILADLTVEENLLAGGFTVPRRELQRRIAGFYERFEVLGRRRRQLAGTLSGGEQQVLAIARALVSRPRLLLMDEPSLGLAPRVVGQVAALIREIRGEGVAVLLVEQNARMALDLADRGVIVENGRVVLEGTAEALRDDPDVQAFYLGTGGDAPGSFRDVKHYRRRRRWLS